MARISKSLLYRLVTLTIGLAAFSTVLSVSGSYTKAVIALVVVVVLYFPAMFVLSIYKGRHIKRIINQVSDKTPIASVDFENEAESIHDFVIFGGDSTTAVIKVGTEGIFLFSTALFSCTIPWSRIVSIKPYWAGKKLRARLNFLDLNNEIVIGWDEEYNRYVPQSTGLSDIHL